MNKNLLTAALAVALSFAAHAATIVAPGTSGFTTSSPGVPRGTGMSVAGSTMVTVWPWMGAPFRYVPLRPPRSRMTRTSPSTCTSQCMRDIAGSLGKSISASDDRPIS